MRIDSLRQNSLQWFLLLAFAIALGDFSFRVWNPAPAPEYMVSRSVQPLSLAPSDPPRKHLYLRQTWYMTEPPERAWLEVLGHDRVEVFVNGRNVGRSPMVSQSRIAAVLDDITPFLHVGRNSIAIHAPQLQLDRPPEVAVNGECEFADGSTITLGDLADWRATDIFDRRGEFWFETDFPDEHWGLPHVGKSAVWRGQVGLPPRAVTEPRRSQWVMPAADKDGAAAMARTFAVLGSPRDGWLRVLATGPCRVAVNGWLVADDHEDLGTEPPFRAVERTFDISPVLRSGSNTISLMVTTAGETPRLRADLETNATNGSQVYVATDDSWRSAAGAVKNWQRPDLSGSAWQPCRAEVGYLGVVPRATERELVEINLPVAFWSARWAVYLGWIGLWGLLPTAGCIGVSNILNRTKLRNVQLPAELPYVALLPSTVLAVAGGLMTWDLAWTAHDIYRAVWLLGLLLLVVVQWLVLILIATRKAGAFAPVLQNETALWRRLKPAGIALCWVAVIGVAFWLRVRDIVAEPIHHDEVTAYAFTQGVLDHGFPGGQVHPDVPFGYCATNELTYYFTALCTPFVDDPRLVLRIPAVFFSMATLLLIAYIGWRWFNAYVGFLAAVLFALSPHIIGMANFGRYLSQVQFFTLLTMYLTYEAVRGVGPLRVGMLWGAAASFAAMYLSWEGTGMFGVGLALAVLFHRRRHLRPLFACPSFYVASTMVGLVVLAQNAHRVMQQTQRLWYGEGISSLTIKPMWRYPFFQYDYFLINSAWTRDALLPMVALGVACVMAVGHRWRFPLRFSLFCLLTNALLMAFFLPVRTNRYSYHLTEIFILITAAVAVAGGETIVRCMRKFLLPAAYGWYVRGVAAAAIAIGAVLCSGWFVRTSEITRFANSSFDVRQLRFPDWEGPTEYLKDHLLEGDVVISIYPHSQDYMFAAHQIGEPKPRTVDYWLESRLVLQATLGDSTSLPLDRRSGAVMLYNLEQVKQLFSQHERIWYCTMRQSQSKINESIVSQYIRENMDVIFEDFGTALMLRDKSHRPASIQLEEEESGRVASEFYLK